MHGTENGPQSPVTAHRIWSGIRRSEQRQILAGHYEGLGRGYLARPLGPSRRNAAAEVMIRMVESAGAGWCSTFGTLWPQSGRCARQTARGKRSQFPCAARSGIAACSGNKVGRLKGEQWFCPQESIPGRCLSAPATMARALVSKPLYPHRVRLSRWCFPQVPLPLECSARLSKL
jgi:hypothetical protein